MSADIAKMEQTDKDLELEIKKKEDDIEEIRKRLAKCRRNVTKANSAISKAQDKKASR